MSVIAIFGGSFNPPHRAHLRIAREFCDILKPDKMLIIPTFTAPHKDIKYYVPASDRMKMCELLFSDDIFEVSDIEIKREGKSYTIDTMTELEKKYPDSEFYLIIGSDMLLSFHKWFRYEDILSKCTLCVMTREGDISVSQLRHYANQVLRLSDNSFVISQSGAYEMSSTQIREKLISGEDASELLSREVYDYIKEKGLYL